jgi:hypothetical protein
MSEEKFNGAPMMTVGLLLFAGLLFYLWWPLGVMFVATFLLAGGWILHGENVSGK